MKRQSARKITLFVSLLLFPLSFFYLSPVLILEGSYFGIINGSFIIFMTLLVTSIFVGRLWCSWICPGGADGELCQNIRQQRVSNKYNFIKFLIWIPWILTIAYLAIMAGGYHRIDFFFQTFHGISITGPESLVALFIVLAVITLPNLIIGRRAVCHYLCWMAPFMIIGEKINGFFKLPRVRIIAKPEKCIDCMSCTKNCPMSLEVNKMVHGPSMDNTECILCGTCVDNCPKKVISYRFKSRD